VNLAAIVMAAGLGTRMRSERPKHLHPLLGRRLVDWPVEAARAAGVDPIVVVASPGHELRLEGVTVAIQEEPRGTGDAVATARPALEGFDGDVLVLPGDAPLLDGDILMRLVETHRVENADVTLLTLDPGRPLPYGRVVRENSKVVRVVEERDATEDERAIGELNASVYVFRAAALWPAVERLDAANAQGELYLTDTIASIAADGGTVATLAADDPAVGQGVNTRVDLAEAAALLRERILRDHMLAGVTVVDPATTWIEPDVELEPDTTIQPFTVLRGRTIVRTGAEVGPHVVATDAEVGPGATVGPFAHLRPGARLGAGSRVGTFVEVKNSEIGERTKVPHLSYIGDAEIGEDTNIGAGAITANYRPELGEGKQRTVIGRNVHTGSDNVFVAPVEIGDNAWVGAGSVITEDVPAGALAIARARQVVKERYEERERHE
jgi:bifunctional UDP-N-acetylglucosamine pyrophosphorylase/glucosamine-1-phosphate N-acetyltransferase